MFLTYKVNLNTNHKYYMHIVEDVFVCVCRWEGERMYVFVVLILK